MTDRREVGERRDDTEARAEARQWDRLKFIWQIFVWCVGVLVTGIVAYNAAANSMSTRVTALETLTNANQRQEDEYHASTDRRFIELREELKEVNTQLRQLIDLELKRTR